MTRFSLGIEVLGSSPKSEWATCGGGGNLNENQVQSHGEENGSVPTVLGSIYATLKVLRFWFLMGHSRNPGTVRLWSHKKR